MKMGGLFLTMTLNIYLSMDANNCPNVKGKIYLIHKLMTEGD